jgi:hypothetical protein
MATAGTDHNEREKREKSKKVKKRRLRREAEQEPLGERHKRGKQKREAIGKPLFL